MSFELFPGDRVGLVGHNGAGKTTLLRVLAGVYAPVQGHIEVQGKVVSLLDISLGIEEEATGHENIFMRGVMMGLSPREIRRNAAKIAEFTALGDYLEMPVRTYSAGMQMRLAFAVSTGFDADIVLMDEWLSVGDADFARKAAERLDDLVRRSKILVLASHSTELVDRMCNRVIRLEAGKIVSEEDRSAVTRPK